MAVYVDDVGIPAAVRNGEIVHQDRWSRLLADTPRELHAFATGPLGLRRSYFQDHWPHPHYDLTSGKRQQALAKGAIAIEYGQAADTGRWLPPLLVTSSREGVTDADVEAALKPRFDALRVLYAGGARGGDRIAARLWHGWGGEVEEFPVTREDWARSRQAGHQRNGRMVAKAAARGGDCVAVVAACADPKCPEAGSHDSHGTANCMDQAREAGLDVERIPAGREAEPQQRRHTWQTRSRDQKECASCHTVATRTRQPGQAGWTVSFLVPGQAVPGDTVPPCMDYDQVPVPAGPSEPAAEMPGDEVTTAGQVIRRGKHDETARCECGNEFVRPLGATNGTCLDCEQRERLARARLEVLAELEQLVAWNSDVFRLHAQAAAARQAPAGTAAGVGPGRDEKHQEPEHLLAADREATG
jgi:hypothetical protein